MKGLNDYPRWKAENDKLEELKTKFSELDQELQFGLSALNRQARQRDLIESEAERLLDGGQVTTDRIVTAADVDELRKKIKVVRRAIEMQRARITQLRSEISKEICVDARPQYAGIVREMSKVVGKLQGLLEQEQSFRRKMQDEDIIFVDAIRPCFISGLLGEGKHDHYSRINHFFREAVEAGYLKPSEPEIFSR